MSTSPRSPVVGLLPFLLVLVWLLFSPPVVAQEVQRDTTSNGDDPPVPQTFDWHLDEPIGAATPWGQAVDTASTRLMRSWTTAPEFTNPLVDHLPVTQGVPTPLEHFGYPLGKPGVLHTSGELYAWYEALAAASPRVAFHLLDETEEGRRFALVQVGSEENLARLEDVREAYHRLTDPRRTSRDEMEELIRDLPVIYTVFSGLHSPETGHPEVTAELAYRVAVSDHPMIREIRDGAVLFIVPVTDPDGRDRVVEWYRLQGMDQVYEQSDRAPGPPFWGKYIRHDNNRDGLQLTLALSRQVVGLYEHWKYPIALDLHESVPFLYVSTGTGPYNPNIDAITRHEWQWIAHHEVTQLTAHGMPGVWTHDFFDGWNPGYMVFALNNRNAIGRFYETFGNSLPTTMERTVPPGRTSVEWFRANPPTRSVLWSLRNNINYAQSGVLHSVHLLARNRDEVLRNYWRKNMNAVERGRVEAPHAWVMPADQPRKADVAHMLNLLLEQGVEVHRAEGRIAIANEADAAERSDAEERSDAADGSGRSRAFAEPGDFVIRADQPYRNFVKNLMEVQRFPEDAPRPYDDVAWTFPLLYNVMVEEATDPAVLEGAMTAVTDRVALPGSVRDLTGRRESVAWWAVRHEASAHLLEARFALGEELEVQVAPRGLEVGGGETFGPGTWLIPADLVPEEDLRSWADRFGLEVAGVGEGRVADVERRPQTLPRIALLHSWRNTQDDGSIRYAFDTMGIPYTYLSEDRLRTELRGADLRERYDVVLFPDQGRGASARVIFDGLDPEQGPLPWEPHEEYPALGRISTTPDMTGGLGLEGILALREFVEAGGTLVTLGSATTVPVEFGLVRDVSIRSTDALFSPGSIVRGRAEDPSHPILWGYEEEFPVFDRFGPYLGTAGSRDENVVVRLAPPDELFMSGLVLGREELGGQPAVVSAPLGEGHVVLFGIRVLHRNQTRGSFAMAWNAILNWDALGGDGAGARTLADDGPGGK